MTNLPQAARHDKADDDLGALLDQQLTPGRRALHLLEERRGRSVF